MALMGSLTTSIYAPPFARPLAGDYITNRSMRSRRLAIFAIAAALMLVLPLARAQQRVELRDATRLSIKHSWLGVTPPTKAIVAPVTVAVLPVPAIDLAPAAVATWPVVSDDLVLSALVLDSSDPLRGPPPTLA